MTTTVTTAPAVSARAVQAAPAPQVAKPSMVQLLSRAFRSRNYRLFFLGQIISQTGTWMTQVATSYLVYTLTGDALKLGMINFAGQIPSTVLSPMAGVWIDRWNVRRLLVVTQSLAMLTSATLAVLTLTGLVYRPDGIMWILLLYVGRGVINAFDIPSRQSFVVQMVERREDLPNAIALNSSLINSARLIGPSVAGLLIWWFGVGVCYSIDAISYIAVIVALLMMRVSPRKRTGPPKHVLTELAEGFRYGLGFAPIRAILLLLAMVSLVGAPYVVLMPVFALKVLHGDARTQGIMMGAIGVGALIAAVRLAARPSVLGLGRVMALAAVGFGLSLIAFGFSRNLYLSMPLLGCCGYCMITQMASGNTLLQTIVDDDKRGRVMSLYTLSFAGMVPLGSLLCGILTQRLDSRFPGLGAPMTVQIGGVCCLFAAALFFVKIPALRKLVHPIYVERGIILPPVAQALENASEPAAVTVPTIRA